MKRDVVMRVLFQLPAIAVVFLPISAILVSGDAMKSKRNKLIIGGVAGIVAMFLLSLFLPAFQPFAKAGALVIYALVNYVQIKEMKRNGQDIEKPALFTAAVLIIVGYLLFFT